MCVFDYKTYGHNATGGHDFGTILYEIDQMTHGHFYEQFDPVAEQLRQVTLQQQ